MSVHCMSDASAIFCPTEVVVAEEVVVAVVVMEVVETGAISGMAVLVRIGIVMVATVPALTRNMHAVMLKLIAKIVVTRN